MNRGILEELLQQLADHQFIKENMLYTDEIHTLLDRLKDDTFKVAIVGEFSSGKSTFINSILKKDILKHESKETTACITYIINVSPASKENGTCEVVFKDGHSITINNVNDLKEFTTTNSVQYNVSSEIEAVMVKLHFFDENENMVLVDTPGLNGVADRHRELTIEEVKSSHACIYLLQLRSLSLSDLDFIRYLTKYQSSFIFVQNFIDEINIGEGETVEQKLESIERILQEEIFASCDSSYSYTVCGISALKALASYDTNIKRLYTSDLMDLTEKDRLRLGEESNYRQLRALMTDSFGREVYDKVKLKSIEASFNNLLADLLRSAEEALEDQRLLTGRSGNRERLEELSVKKDLLIQRKERNLERVQNFILSEQNKIRWLLIEELRKSLENVCRSVSDSIDREQNYEIFRRSVNEHYYAKLLQEQLYDTDEKSFEDMRECFQQLYNNVLLRIDEMCHWNQLHSENRELDIIKVENEYKSYEYDKDYLKTLQDKINVNKDIIARTEIENKKYHNEILELQQEVSSKENSLNFTENEKRLRIQAMGNRPQKRTGTREETYEEYRGGFGILDALFGPKIKKRQVPYEDDSAGLNWDKEMRSINEKVNSQKEVLSRQISQLRIARDNRNETILRNEREKSAAESSLIRLDKQLKEKEEEIRFLEEKARREFLQSQKKILKDSIHRYLFEGEEAATAVKERDVCTMVSENTELITGKAMEYFRMAYDKNIGRLDEIINSKQDEINSKLSYIEDIIAFCRQYTQGGTTNEISEGIV